MFPKFIFACSLAFMFACTFVLTFAGVGIGLSDAVTVVVELVLALLFEFSAVLQATPRIAKASKVRKPVCLLFHCLSSFIPNQKTRQ